MEKHTNSHKSVLGFLWKLAKEFSLGTWRFIYAEVIPTVLAWLIVVVPLLLLILFVPMSALKLVFKVGVIAFIGVLILLLLICAYLSIKDSWEDYNNN